MQIRFAQPQDVKTIYQFVCELEGTEFNFALFEKIFLRNITHPDYLYLVAEIAKDIVGYLSCHTQLLLHHCGNVGEIQELFILPNQRNKGIGQALIKKIERLAKENNWVNIEVTCNQNRTNTHRFYDQIDFINTHFKFVKEIK